ncbi:uncharacterized protein N7483_005641 [Penicillium malachiteum]|uniref:uncharacterized protein n=1 Tax=Penicillium malachiteum TaxID=1324776 RepID=UPI002547B961|nr:uncharacterized protein N7483_005641 [Penicillium malachiteum]KAJ5731133.1 hypothetical protein N7483_005641 [Penicillium malachiteum]
MPYQRHKKPTALEFMFGELERASGESKTLGGKPKDELLKQQTDSETSAASPLRLSKRREIHTPHLSDRPGEPTNEIQLPNGSLVEPGRVLVKGT